MINKKRTAFSAENAVLFFIKILYNEYFIYDIMIF